MVVALPTGPRGRLLALGIALLLAAAVWAVLVDPLLGWHARLVGAVENRGAVARRMAAVAETLPELRRQAAAGAEQPVAAALLEGATDALAGAALQVRVRELAAQAEASLTSSETLPAEAAGGFRRIGVRVSVTGTWPVLVRLLREVGQASPGMLVDDVQMQAAPSLVSGAARPLAVTLTVLAFRAADLAAPQQAAAPPRAAGP